MLFRSLVVGAMADAPCWCTVSRDECERWQRATPSLGRIRELVDHLDADFEEDEAEVYAVCALRAIEMAWRH